MFRSVCVLGAALLFMGCNPADVRDNSVQFSSGNEVGFGDYLNAYAGTITVDGASRGAIERWEVEASTSYILANDEVPSGEVSILLGLLDEVASGRLSDGTADALWDNVPIAACNDVGFEITADDGCRINALVLVGSNTSSAFTASMSVKGWLPDDSEVDADNFVVNSVLDEGE